MVVASTSAPSAEELLYAPRGPLPAQQRKLKRGTFAFMLANHVGAVAALLPMFWSWQGILAFAVLYWTTVLGVTLGLHRLVAHRSFEAPRWLERVLVLMGTLACRRDRWNGWDCTATTTNFPINQTTTTMPAAASGGPTAAGCCTAFLP